MYSDTCGRAVPWSLFCGELCEAIRKIEHGKDCEVDLEKEMGDVLLSLLTLAIRYDVDLQEAFDRTIEDVKKKYVVKKPEKI